MREKKNPDYSASAVNLCNPNEVHARLLELHTIQEKAERLDAVLHALPEYEELEACQQEMTQRRQDLQVVIDQLGSYQDTTTGEYAVKQRKLSKQYNAELFEQFYPEFARAILKKVVDTVKLNGLVKGGLVNEDGMRHSQVMTETETYAYIIR